MKNYTKPTLIEILQNKIKTIDILKKRLLENKKVKIELEDYHHTCGDGCCDDYGTIIKVNDEELDCTNQDVDTILEEVLIKLGYEVELIRI